MKTAHRRGAVAATIVLGCAMLVFAQKPNDHEMMDRRGAKAMGFDQAKALHHFYLLKNGGAVELSAKDPNDKETIAAIQQHLALQAKAFEKGNFEAPIETHGKPPDGVPVLKKLRREITFEVVQMDAGAALRMFTINAQARQAIHDFMKFQIQEHQTGDPMEVEQ